MSTKATMKTYLLLCLVVLWLDKLVTAKVIELGEPEVRTQCGLEHEMSRVRINATVNLTAVYEDGDESWEEDDKLNYTLETKGLLVFEYFNNWTGNWNYMCNVEVKQDDRPEERTPKFGCVSILYEFDNNTNTGTYIAQLKQSARLFLSMKPIRASWRRGARNYQKKFPSNNITFPLVYEFLHSRFLVEQLEAKNPVKFAFDLHQFDFKRTGLSSDCIEASDRAAWLEYEKRNAEVAAAEEASNDAKRSLGFSISDLYAANMGGFDDDLDDPGRLMNLHDYDDYDEDDTYEGRQRRHVSYQTTLLRGVHDVFMGVYHRVVHGVNTGAKSRRRRQSDSSEKSAIKDQAKLTFCVYNLVEPFTLTLKDTQNSDTDITVYNEECLVIPKLEIDSNYKNSKAIHVSFIELGGCKRKNTYFCGPNFQTDSAATNTATWLIWAVATLTVIGG